MTLLTVDIGNSLVKAGFWDGATLLTGQPLRFPADRTKSAGDWAAQIADETETAGLPAVNAIIMASVVPTLTPVWIEMSERLWGTAPLVVTSQTDTGLTSRYQTQATLGADRWVNAFAAHALLGPPNKNAASIVVDFGTATKWEAVAPGGVYLGGAIAPGVATGRDALFSRAALLSGVPLDLAPPIPVIGTNTQAALQAGILRGAAGMTDQIIGGMMGEMNAAPPNCCVFATGGLAPLIAPHCQTVLLVVPHLTLNGLRLLYARFSALSA